MTQVWARAFRLDLAHSSSRSAPSSSPYKVSSHDVGGGNQHAQSYFFHRMHEKCILASETRLLKEIKFRFLTETEKVLRFSIVDNHVRKIISTPKKSQISFRAFFSEIRQKLDETFDTSFRSNTFPVASLFWVSRG